MTWQCEPGDPRPPFSKSVPSFATMGETQNELRLNKRERGERKGAGVVVKAKGGSEQNAHLGGQREYGDQLPLPLPPRQHGPHPPQNAHTHTHTLTDACAHSCRRGFTFLMRRVGAPTVEKQIRLFCMPFFPRFSFSAYASFSVLWVAYIIAQLLLLLRSTYSEGVSNFHPCFYA